MESKELSNYVRNVYLRRKKPKHQILLKYKETESLSLDCTAQMKCKCIDYTLVFPK